VQPIEMCKKRKAPLINNEQETDEVYSDDEVRQLSLPISSNVNPVHSLPTISDKINPSSINSLENGINIYKSPNEYSYLLFFFFCFYKDLIKQLFANSPVVLEVAQMDKRVKKFNRIAEMITAQSQATEKSIEGEDKTLEEAYEEKQKEIETKQQELETIQKQLAELLLKQSNAQSEMKTLQSESRNLYSKIKEKQKAEQDFQIELKKEIEL